MTWWSLCLPDGGRGYLTKMYNDTWMRENGFYETPAQPTLADVLAFRHSLSPDVPLVVGVSPDDSIAEAIGRFHRYGISQLPVLDAGTCSRFAYRELPAPALCRRRAAA